MIPRKWTFLTLGSGKTRGKGATRVSLEPHPEEGEGFTGLVYWAGPRLGLLFHRKKTHITEPLQSARDHPQNSPGGVALSSADSEEETEVQRGCFGVGQLVGS